MADSSLEKDRIAKAPLYAKAGIPEYWILNLEDRQLESFRIPVEGVYKEKKIYSITDRISSEELSAPIAIADFFPT